MNFVDELKHLSFYEYKTLYKKWIILNIRDEMYTETQF